MADNPLNPFAGRDSWDMSVAKAEIFLFQDYLTVMEQFLESETQKHRKSLEHLIASGQVYYDKETGVDQNYDSEMLNQIFSFKDTLRKSFFISLYSFLEFTMLQECRSRKNEDKTILLSLDDLAGQNGIDKAQTYFTKVLRLKSPSDTPEWSEIQNYKTLRNCIVHAGGRIEDIKTVSDQEKLKAFIARKAHKRTLWLSDYDGVILDKGFCEKALATIEKFLQAWLSGH